MKKIIEIGSNSLGTFAVGYSRYINEVYYPHVKSITESEMFPNTVYIKFEHDDTKSLHILDVVYVIRDEVKE